MTRLSLAVLGAVLLSACGGGEDPKDLTQQQTTGSTVQSGTVDTDTENPDTRVPNKNTEITTPHNQAPAAN